MIKAEHKAKLKELGIDIDAIIAAHNDTAEKDIVIPDGKLYTDDQLATRDGEKLKEGKKEGEKAALSIAKTELGKHGFDLKAERFGDLAKELTDKVNANGDQKLKDLQEQNRLLLEDKTTLATKVTEAENQLKTGMFEINVLSKLPPNSLGLSAKEVFELAKIRGYQPELTETGTVWKKNGEILKDPATHAPLPEDKAIAHIWTEQKWTPAAAPVRSGRGGEQRPSGGAATGLMSKSEVEAAWSEQNPDKGIATPEGMAFYAQYAKQDGFDMYS